MIFSFSFKRQNNHFRFFALIISVVLVVASVLISGFIVCVWQCDVRWLEKYKYKFNNNIFVSNDSTARELCFYAIFTLICDFFILFYYFLFFCLDQPFLWRYFLFILTFCVFKLTHVYQFFYCLCRMFAEHVWCMMYNSKSNANFLWFI